MTSAPAHLPPPSERIRHLAAALRQSSSCDSLGRIVRVVGLIIEAAGPRVAIGDLCRILSPAQPGALFAEVVGFRDDRVLLMPLQTLHGIEPGTLVSHVGRPLRAPIGPALLGRVLDSFGRPIDDAGPLAVTQFRPLENAPPHPLKRQRISVPLQTGVKAIDTLVPCGRGQRLGIFAGSGVGKSTLLGMIARHTAADVNVIALIGERGREVREFLENDLGPEGRRKSVVVVATSHQPALARVKGATLALGIAEGFRDAGKDVLLMMDSVTRFAMAQREIGLAVGEPPATRGYTPSVFALLPQLLERAGAGECGTITGLFTVLVEADDMNDPIADAVRSILDGHLVLTRALATQQQYPAIDVLESVSRLQNELTPAPRAPLARQARELLAAYRKHEDLIQIGAYAAGANPLVDAAIRAHEPLRQFLRQSIRDGSSLEQSWNLLHETLRAAAPPAPARK